MPKGQRGFVLTPALIVIAFLVFATALLVVVKKNQIGVNKASQKSQGDIIGNYPHECERRMGWDNWRTFKSFTVDPSDPKTLYVAVEYKGVYKSQDGGITWTGKNKGLKGYPTQKDPQTPCHEQYHRVLIDPKNSKRLILTSATSPGTLKDRNSGNGGVYESLDGGESWHQLFKDDMNAWTYDAVILDPTNPKVMYIGTTSMPGAYDEADPNKIFVTRGIIYKTEDGKNWEELPTGFVPNLRSGGLFMDPDDNRHLLFTTAAIPPIGVGVKYLASKLGY